MDVFNVVRSILKEEIEKNNEIAIFPMGKTGFLAYQICHDLFGRDCLRIDNELCDFNREIISLDEFMKTKLSQTTTIILCTASARLANELKSSLGETVNYRDILDPYENIMYLEYDEKIYDAFKMIREYLKVYSVEDYELVRVGDDHDKVLPKSRTFLI